MALGRDLAKDFERSSRILEDPVICEYINRIGQNLAQQADPPFALTIRVVRSDEVNSVALPGGYIFINTGLIHAAETESELAVALAHEIGHVVARHQTHQATLGDIFQMASVPLIMIGGWPGVMIREGVTLGTPLVMSRISRGAENEADRLGITYLNDAGYDPTAFVDLLERLSRLGKTTHGPLAAAFSSHPAINSRIRAVQKVIQRDLGSHQEYLVQTSEFERIKERLTSIEHGNLAPRMVPYIPATTQGPPVLRRAQ
jgi:predicted Zn-dependent protease